MPTNHFLESGKAFDLVLDFLHFASSEADAFPVIDGIYIVKRIHSALGYLTPMELEQQWRREHSPTGAAEPTTTRT